MLLAETHLTVLGDDVGRRLRFALWNDGQGTETVELVLPTTNGVRRRNVTARVVAIGDLLDELVTVGLESSHHASVRAWALSARLALELISHGRLTPSIGPDGTDLWALAPLSDSERSMIDDLAEWLPVEAHCSPSPDPKLSRITDPIDAVHRVWGAIADTLPRTSAAPIVAQQDAWARMEPTDVTAVAALLPSTQLSPIVVGLRIAFPDHADAPFRLHFQARSVDQPELVVDADAVWSGQATHLDGDIETTLLVALRRTARLVPAIHRALDEAAPVGLELTHDEAAALLSSDPAELAAVGVELLVPTSQIRQLRVTARVDPPPGAGDTIAQFDLATACELTWRPTLDGEPVSDAELAMLADARRAMVQLRGQWVVVDPTIMAKLGRRDTITGSAAVGAALTGSATIDGEQVTVEVVGAPADLGAALLSATGAHDLDEPDGLHAELRPYQRRGLGWLVKMANLGMGGVLADDMGLGKTIQIIALHLHRMGLASADPAWRPAPMLVVCPASVVGNWQRELSRFAPSLVVHRFHGPERHLDSVGDHDVVVTTYGVVRRDQDMLAARRWGLVVADEAQVIKNPNAAAARALRRLSSDARIAATGTPVENRLTELWALLDWTTPGILGTVDTFRREFSLPIERERDADTAARLGRLIAPFVLRRRKSDPEIVPELPPKTETVHPVTLNPEQAGLYRAVTDEVMAQVERADGIARRGLVLKLLTALKQICNHPAHYLRQPGPLADRSGKLDAFDDLIVAITDAGDSTLVFTQYVSMVELLSTRLDELGIAHRTLTGSTSVTARTALVDRFQAGEFPVLIISLRAGGTGLNLTRATHVVHYDRWWNPAVEAQASDRAWRIGQDRPVQVHQLISNGTIEERIATVLADKAALADAVVGSGEAWIGELSNDDLAELVRLADEAH